MTKKSGPEYLEKIKQTIRENARREKHRETILTLSILFVMILLAIGI